MWSSIYSATLTKVAVLWAFDVSFIEPDTRNVQGGRARFYKHIAHASILYETIELNGIERPPTAKIIYIHSSESKKLASDVIQCATL